MKPRYPIYIVSKGRWESRLTVKALLRIGITDFKVIIEKQEYKHYSKVIDLKNILILPQGYLDKYETMDDLGDTKSKGPGGARNYAMDHSIRGGYKRHWVLDDNLDDFHRLNRNIKCPVRTPATFCAAEDFVDRYENVPLSGFNYYSFCKATDGLPPFIINTRIYSCLLIENNIGYRWRGRYNEDTDLSLRVLKDGRCTIQFNAFLCGKVTTQRMKGGNTKEFYKKDGTMDKSQMIVDLHPDDCKIVWRFGRWHHYCNYKPYKENKLIPISPKQIYTDINEYDMKLIERD